MVNNKLCPIGVFDSGFGGLEILREVVKKLPQYDYIYLGDTARTPYGTRSPKIIYNFTKQAVNYLFGQNCKLIILACNTASSKALRKIQQEYLPKKYPDRRILGVLIPASEEAIERTRNQKIGVIATEGTISSKAFERELKKINKKVKVFQKAAPLLVSIVESGEQNSRITELALKNYLNPLIKNNIDTLILGCTHYGILESKIRSVTGSRISLIIEGEIVAKKLKDYLKRHPDMENQLSKNRKISFLTTDLSGKFETLGSLFFGKLIHPQQITLK